MSIIELLKKPEGKTLEFKRDLSSSLGIVRTLIAFANTAGGTLIIGVEDKTHYIIGVSDPLSQEEKITNFISDLIEPLILPEIEILPYKQTQILIIRVYPSPIRPHFLKTKGLENGTFVRVGSSNRQADPTLIQEMKRFTSNQPYDEQPLLQLHSDAIDFETASRFFAPFRNLKTDDLKTLRLVVEHQAKLVPTVAGILLFGKNREEYFPDAWIQAGRFFGTDKSKITDSVEIHSYPVVAIEYALEFVQKHATLSLEIDAAKRTESWNIPLKAVREAIINAVTHADYSQTGSPIRLSIFQDRLEIENPGLLPFGLTIEEISLGVSKLRNRVIGRIFNELKLIEQWGSGIQRIISACEENGLAKPKFEEIGTHFRVTIYIEKKRDLQLDDHDQAILHLLQRSKGMSTHDISNKIKLSTRAIRTRLASLIERGFIIQVSSGPHDPSKRFFIRQP
jgi:predicted HTH transcriptional regulator